MDTIYFDDLSVDSNWNDLKAFIDQEGLSVSKRVGPGGRTKADIYEDIKKEYQANKGKDVTFKKPAQPQTPKSDKPSKPNKSTPSEEEQQKQSQRNPNPNPAHISNVKVRLFPDNPNQQKRSVDSEKDFVTRQETEYFVPDLTSAMKILQVSERYCSLEPYRRARDRHPTLTLTIRNVHFAASKEEHLKLTGPKEKMQIFLDIFANQKAPDWNTVMFPIFVPTKGKAASALPFFALEEKLNPKQISVLIMVVEPFELPDYLARFPNYLYLVLPNDNYGIGYSRFCVKRMCQESWTSGGRLGFPNIWMIDDNVKELTTKAFLYVQNLENPDNGLLEPTECGIMGFHNAGSRAKPDYDTSTTTLSVFKVLLLNVNILKNIDYVAGVIWPEDMMFNMRVHQAQIRILKVYKYEYRFDANKKGNKPNKYGHFFEKHTDLLLSWRHNQLLEWERQDLLRVMRLIRIRRIKSKEEYSAESLVFELDHIEEDHKFHSQLVCKRMSQTDRAIADAMKSLTGVDVPHIFKCLKLSDMGVKLPQTYKVLQQKSTM